MSMRNLTSESMKLEMHGMGAEIKELRAKLALAEKKLAIAVEGLDRLSIHEVQSSYRCIDEQGSMSYMDEAFEGGYIEARDQFHVIAQEVREKIEEVK